MATSSKNVSSLQFDHPTAGRCRVEVSILAVRWRGTSSAEQRRTWLGEAGAELLTAAKDAVAPLAQVNQTDGLSWVRGGVEALRKLESSDAVEWVAPALRPEQTDARSGDPVAPDLAMFTVNPSRFYVRQALVDTAPAEALKAIGVSVDASRPARLRGYATAQVDDASFSAGRSTVHVAASLAKALGVAAAGGGDIRYETIPLLSPAAHAPGEIAAPVRADSRLPACRPPSSEFHPNDPMFAQQWGLQRVGAPRAWEIMRGLPAVTVAVLDEGVELGHPDLNLHPQSWNASSDTPDGGPTGNHGTACAGIVAARMDNAQGVAGIAGGARIMAIATATWADVDIAEGLYFAADNGARVVSMSFGVYASWNFWDFDIVRDALQYAHDRGLLLVAASGNENGPQARFPGSDGRTLCVGGSNRSDERKRIGDASSEAWWGASYGPDVDVVAPCLEMPTTDRFGASGYAAGDYHDRFNGTSSATPLVAGLGALLFSLRPVLSNVEARRIIESTCDKISPSLYAYANVGGKPQRHLEQRGRLRPRQRRARTAQGLRGRLRLRGGRLQRLRRPLRGRHARGLPRSQAGALAAVRPLHVLLRGAHLRRRKRQQRLAAPAPARDLPALPAPGRPPAGAAVVHDDPAARRGSAPVRVRPLPAHPRRVAARVGARFVSPDAECAVAVAPCGLDQRLLRYPERGAHACRYLRVGRWRAGWLPRGAAGQGRVRRRHRDHRGQRRFGAHGVRAVRPACGDCLPRIDVNVNVKCRACIGRCRRQRRCPRSSPSSTRVPRSSRPAPNRCARWSTTSTPSSR
jgi:subtilisin family serine protease